MSVFQVRVNGGPEQTIDVQVSQYRLAAAAVPALLGCYDLPAVVEIWSATLVPEYGPYFYTVDEDRYGNVVVYHDLRQYAARSA